MTPFVEHYERLLGPGRREGTQWVLHCPFDGCVGYRKMKFYISPETGAWQCKHCCQAVPGKTYRRTVREPHGGTWRDFVYLWNLLFPDRREDPSLWPDEHFAWLEDQPTPLPLAEAQSVWTLMFTLGRLLPEHAAHLQNRGVDPYAAGIISATPELGHQLRQLYPDDYLIQLGLARKDSQGQLKPRLCFQGGRMLIPHWLGEKVAHFVGYAPKPPLPPGGDPEEHAYWYRDWVKYAGVAGYSPQVYGEIPHRAPYLIITEGHIKALVAQQRGFPCVGLVGMGSSHLLVARLCRTHRVQKAIILFDTQVEDQDNIDYEADQLARHLLTQQVRAYRAQLPLDPAVDGGRKMDIDAFLLHRPTEELVEILKHSVQYRPQL